MITKKLGDKIKCKMDGETMVLTRQFCKANGKEGLYWVGEGFYVPDKEIPADAVVIESHNTANRKYLYKPQKVDFSGDWKAFEKNIKANMKRLKEIDKMQKEKGDILYRYLSFPYADSASLYQITSLNTKTATIQSVTGIGDDWEAFGKKASLDLGTVLDNLSRRDRMNELFESRKNNKTV